MAENLVDGYTVYITKPQDQYQKKLYQISYIIFLLREGSEKEFMIFILSVPSQQKSN